MSKKTDMSAITTFIHTLAPENNEIALPGFMQFDLDSDFSLSSQIGKGGTAMIFQGEIVNEEMLKYAGTNICVIKIITPPENAENDGQAEVNFVQEVSLMWLFRNHINFVKLFGFSLDPPTVVMKFYPHGSLSHYIFNKANATKITNELLLNLGQDITRGIAAMHDMGIAHSDIKPENVLIDEINGRVFAVISDLGISRVLADSSVHIVKSFNLSKVQGASAPFASPELFQRIRSSEQSTNPLEFKAADAYAFAITFWEIVCRKRAWKNERGWLEIESKVAAGKRPQYPPRVELTDDILVIEFKRIIEKCWLQDFKVRMTIHAAKLELDRVARENNIKSSDDSMEISSASEAV